MNTLITANNSLNKTNKTEICKPLGHLLLYLSNNLGSQHKSSDDKILNPVANPIITIF